MILIRRNITINVSAVYIEQYFTIGSSTNALRTPIGTGHVQFGAWAKHPFSVNQFIREDIKGLTCCIIRNHVNVNLALVSMSDIHDNPPVSHSTTNETFREWFAIISDFIGDHCGTSIIRTSKGIRSKRPYIQISPAIVNNQSRGYPYKFVPFSILYVFV